MSDDSGKEDVSKEDLQLLKHKEHWREFHPENTRCALLRMPYCACTASNAGDVDVPTAHTRRPSYRDPTSPNGTEPEVGVAYSQEEEMAGRLHQQMIENQKKSAANLQAV